MMVSPDSVKVKKRVRKDLGDIEGLSESLKKHGQLHPIIINKDYELISGFRRLQAVKRLGWSAIQAVMIDKQSEVQRLEIEIEENIQRQDLSREELSEGFHRLQRLKKPGLFARLWRMLVDFFRKLFKKIRRSR